MKESATETQATPASTTLPVKREGAQLDGTASKRDCPIPTTIDSTLQVLCLHDKATLPKRGSPLSAGYDLSSAEDKTISVGGRAVIKTGLKMKIPVDCYGRVAPRSGLAVRHGIDTGAGVIDADYRGEVGVVLFNFGQEPFQIKAGDRIAQLILEKIHMADVEKVESLDDTERGEGGFGSTGVTKETN